MTLDDPDHAADAPTGWKPVGLGSAIGLGVMVGLLLALRAASADGWIPILDSANLALHEAGHPLIGMFSERLMVYGGALFQIVFPLAVVAHFKRQQQPLGCAVGGVWLGENLLNIARYMADARAQVLPLVGGGEHDWTEIFSRWGVVHRDLAIAGLTRWLGLALMLGAVAWLWRRSRAPLH